MDASLLQTVFLQNDSAVVEAIEKGNDSWIGQITKQVPDKLSDGSRVEKLDLNRELTRMEVRLKRAKQEGSAKQVEQIENRIRELKQAAEDKREIAKNPGGLAIDEPTAVRQAYLRTLCRLPTPEEMDRCLAYMDQADSPAHGAKGLLWTLLNTKEFIVNH
jgi:hypothetical protein